MYDHHFSNFGRPPVPDDLSKDSATRHPLFWRRRFLMVFTIYEHGGHLGQWTATIFSNLLFPQPKEAPQEIWATLAQRLQRRSRLKFSTFFPYKWMVPIQMHREANLTQPKKGQTSMYNNYFIKFGRPPIPDDLCNDSAQRHPWFWRRRVLKVFTIYGHGGHLGQWTLTILAIFHYPNLRRLHMKFEQNWLRGFRGEVIWKC